MKSVYCVILFGMLALGACRQPKDLVYKDVRNFSMKQAGMKKTTFTMDVRLYNPNKFRLKLKKSDIDVFINGNPLGKINIEGGAGISRFDTSSLPVTLDLNPGTALTNLVSAAFGGNLTIKLSGTIKAGRHGIYVTVPVDYEGKQDDLLSGLLKM